jgi:hypothetical protein
MNAVAKRSHLARGAGIQGLIQRLGWLAGTFCAPAMLSVSSSSTSWLGTQLPWLVLVAVSLASGVWARRIEITAGWRLAEAAGGQ